MNFAEVGRFLLLAGSVVLLVGLVFVMADKFPLGRLLGDINFTVGRVKIHVPIVTCIVFSILITLVVNLFSRK